MDLALFDFDGTITTSDTFLAFIRFAITPIRWRVGNAVLAPWVAAYRLGLLPTKEIRAAAARVAFWGTSEAELRERGEEFATQYIPKLVRGEARRRIDWHRERGDKTVVVSASLDVYLSRWCRDNGMDVLCTTLEMKGGKATGRYLDGDCSGPRKKLEILRRYDIDDYGATYAYGDTLEDMEMLELADHRFFRWQEMPGEPSS